MSEDRLKLECTVDDLKTDGTAVRRDFDRGERLRRAGRTTGLCFGFALLSVFVPLLHFVLPPIFAFAGLILGILTWRETSEVITGEVSCPNCRKPIHLPREAEDWPKATRCPGCSFSLMIRPVD